ncbi:hypothetical protein [Massilia phyllosphaerae]|uniref:hypothetical protein n=1 Tax=Massilia phyllosphaerae TaxID=3106034 RepID=UPI002B1CAF71|nr:hypothetical protein [Massilia sp. SGZ-792]
MPKISKKLFEKLGQQTTKVDWTNVLKMELGNQRRLRGFYTSDPTADPAIDGVEFLNVASVGELPVLAGNVAGFGSLQSATVRAAADLGTGAAILHLEGNDHSISFSLGLPSSGAEFILPSNPTGAPDEGFTFTRNSGVNAPVMLDSGTGPLAPKDGYVVAGFRLIDYPSGARRVVGTAWFSKRVPNIVMEHSFMGAALGDVRKMQVPEGEGIIWGTGGDTYLVAGDTLVGNAVLNSQAPVPLQESEVRMVPYNRWAGYPFNVGFIVESDCLIPPAHKIEWLDKDSNVVDVTEDYATRDANNTPGSGLPVNDPSFNDGHPITTGVPIYEWWNCRMVHPHVSHLPKMHPLAHHFLPGVWDQAMHESQVREHASDVTYWPPLTGTGDAMGLGAWKIAPKWNKPYGAAPDVTIQDPYFKYPYKDGGGTQLLGYGFTPGGSGTYTQATGNGGVRKDRCGWPHPVVKWVTNPDGVRAHGAIPMRTMVHHWFMNQFNQPLHLFTNVYTGEGISKSILLSGDAAYIDGYYDGSDNNYANNLVRLLSSLSGNGTGDHWRDKNKKRFNNEWSRDIEHNNNQAAPGAYFLLSPRFVLESKHTFSAMILAAHDITRSFSKENFMTRAHAWLNWGFANHWLMANNGQGEMSTAEIEAAWARHWEMVHAAVMPAYSDPNNYWGVLLKTLGMPAEIKYKKDPKTDQNIAFRLEPQTDSKTFYFGHVFQLMKQSGSFERMINYSPKCKEIIELQLYSQTLYAVAGFRDTNGRMDKYFSGSHTEHYYAPEWIWPLDTPLPYPKNWGEWFVPNGQEDWIRQYNGDFGDYNNSIDGQNTGHMRAQWLSIMKNFFPEYDFSDRDLALNIALAFYKEVDDRFKIDETQFNNYFSMFGIMKAPERIGRPA